MKNYIVLYVALLLLTSSCREFITLEESPAAIPAERVFQNDATAIAAQTAVYNGLRNFMQDRQGLAYITGFSADELIYFGTYNQRMQIYTNSLSSQNTEVSRFWQSSYAALYQVNSVIEGAGNASTLSAAVKDQLLGEALFSRAFLYFNLVNLYGEVPLVLTTAAEQNRLAPRAEISAVYSQITKDLEDAEPLLTPGYLSGTANSSDLRIRPNRAAAQALLAKVHLYQKNWEKAEQYAGLVIAQDALYRLVPVSEVFLSGSREAIWQLDHSGLQTMEESLFPDIYSAALNPGLAAAFEPADERNSWIGTSNGHFFAYKYKEGVEDAYTLFRLAEQYLIRAEARARQGNLFGAMAAEADVNAIRDRAGLPPTNATNAIELVAEIEHQRRLELFCEMGNRWFDLKRMPALADPSLNRADEVIPALGKPGEWKSTAKLYPVPQSERRANGSLSQNPGYGQ